MNEKFSKAVKEHYKELSKPENYMAVKGQATALQRDIHSRQEFDRNDYFSARPSEQIPTDINDAMSLCEDLYKNTGILRSIIDLITEFVTDGLQILHPEKDIQTLYNAWFRKVDLQNRAERFVSDLYKSGNVVIRRYSGQINKKGFNEWKKSIVMSNKIGINEIPDKDPAVIPTEYFFFRPSSVYLVGDIAGSMSVNKKYGLKIPTKYIQSLLHSNTKLEESVISKIPADIKKSIKENTLSPYINYPLDNSSLYVAHYKKDDYDTWATPIIYSVLEDITYNKKLKMARIAGLDGFYNPIRIWKLGDHTKEILPLPGAGNKLNEILSNNTGGGTADIIWDSMIDVQELYPPIEKLGDFLEYKDPILSCFGIPQEITGGVMETNSGGNAALRMKNFAKKLNSGRKELKKWIEFEIDIIHRNLKLPSKPFVKFKNDDLMDEKIYYTLIRELVDRNILSDRTIVEKMEEIPEIEFARISEEMKLRDSGKLPPKAGPFNNPNLEKQAELDQEKSILDNELLVKPKDSKNKGRPPGSKDALPRRRSPNVKKSFALAYAADAYDKVDKIITARTLEHFQVADTRSLTKDQKEMLDRVRTHTLAEIEPGTELSEDIINNNISYNNDEYDSIYNNLLDGVALENMTGDQRRFLKIEAYCQLWCD